MKTSFCVCALLLAMLGKDLSARAGEMPLVPVAVVRNGPPSVMVFPDLKIVTKNADAKVFFRVPKRYDPKSEVRYRVLVFFGGRNCSGEREAKGIVEFDQWADAHDIFIVAPGFKDDKYWEPEKWSGMALREALTKIRKQYRIDDKHLLFYGYSAGSQASNLFPFWQPERTRAWVSHAGGVFFTPDKKMRRIPGLVTCGDADRARYVISRRFVEQCRALDINIIFKSYPNLNHTVPIESARFAQDFLAYYHYLYWDDLDPDRRNPRPKRESIAFIGDDQEGEYWPAKEKAIRDIAKEDRVYLPSQELAEAWGKPARRWLNMQAQAQAVNP